MFIDIYNTIYVTDGQVVLQFEDPPILLNAAPQAESLYKTFTDIKILPDDFASAFTYNKFFHQLYDNLKILFHTI